MLLTPIRSKAKVICLNLARCWINDIDVSLSMAISAWITRYFNVFVCFVRLLEVGRNLNKADTEGLKQCAFYFKQLDQVDQKLVYEYGIQCLKLPALEGQCFIAFESCATTNLTSRGITVSGKTRVQTVASKTTLSKSLMLLRAQWLQRSSQYPKHSPQPQWLQNPQQ